MVLKVKHNAGSTVKRLRVYQDILEKRLRRLLDQAKGEWLDRARLIIEKVIYGVAPGKNYDRTGNLKKAVTVEKSGDNELILFIDRHQIPDVWESKYNRGYAAYFLRGDGFLRMIGAKKPFRNFMGNNPENRTKWFGMTVQIFTAKYNRAFRDAIRAARGVR